MKKVFYIFGILAMGILASCQKDPVENTACVDMAGDWYVTIDAAKNGQVVYEDVYDIGYVHMFTSNTAANIEFAATPVKEWSVEATEVKENDGSLSFDNADDDLPFED